MTKVHRKYIGLGMPGATFEHDLKISDIDFFIRKSHPKFMIGQSTEIAGINSRRPDISVWEKVNPKKSRHDVNNWRPIVAIEIAKHRRSYNYSLKAIMHAFEQAPSIKESFIFSIFENTWTKVFRTGTTVKSSKCQTLDLDFADAQKEE